MPLRVSSRLGLVVAPFLLAAACGEPFTAATGGTGGMTTSTSNAGGATTSSTSSNGGATTSSTSSSTSTSTSTSSSTSSGCDNTDADKDGYSVCDGDCDDNDPTVNPGAAEICGDSKDNNCNKSIDEGCQGLGTFVSNAGDDNNPGTQQLPVRTIAKGIEHAVTIGNGVSVYVSAGHYPEDVQLVEGVSIYGGYDPSSWAHDPANNDTAILAQSADGVLADSTITRATVIDGFRLQGANGQTTGNFPYGAALTIDQGSPTVTNCVINGPQESTGARSIGVIVLGPSNDIKGPLLKDNRITGGNSSSTSNPCEDSVGVALQYAGTVSGIGTAAEIRKNVIRAGQCKSAHAVVSFTNADGTSIVDNDISAGVAVAGSSFGIVVAGSSVIDGLILIDRNRINADKTITMGCSPISGTQWCGGIDSQAAKATITNNVIFGVMAPKSTAVWLRNPEIAPKTVILHSNYLDGGGTANLQGSQSSAIVLTVNNGTNTTVGRIRNNILVGGAGNARFGAYEDSALGKTCKPEKLDNNDFWVPQLSLNDALYRTWDGAVGLPLNMLLGVNALNNSSNNISADPKVDATFHLMTGSPCIDSGTSNEAPDHDMDNDTRPKNGNYDIGADEK
jgi:hypothetical protein